MKKTLLAIVVATSIISGCAGIGSQDTVSYEELRKDGAELMVNSEAGKYQPSLIKEMEVARLAINSAFLASKPVYERYTEELMNTAELGNFFAATEAADSEEDKRAIYDALPAESKVKVDDFLASSVTKEMMKGLGDAAETALVNIAVFNDMDTKEMLTGVEFSRLLDEKDLLSHTLDQVSYINSTVVSAYKNYKQVSAFKAAQ